MTTTATWHASLDCECPICHEDVDLMEYTDFWDGRTIQIAEHDTPATTDMEVTCPNCGEDFKVTCEW